MDAMRITREMARKLPYVDSDELSRAHRLGRAFLEVTAQNDGAVRLYRRLGFRRRKTLYKAVETAPTLQHVT